jgi:ABC-2 type transport system ATP-binding protein
MLDVRDLAKSFGALRAVDGISFQVKPGEIYGLLGPNGAGKTTTISCICNLMRPDAGTIVLDEIDLAAEPLRFKARIGVVPQETALYGDLSARENLQFWGGLAGLRGHALHQRAEAALEAVGLAERAREPARKLSGGMRRRLNLAIGMLHEPRLLLLDEPTVGIDIQARLNILDVVRGIARRGAAILYTTHYLEEAQELCDRIGIVDHGRILAEGSLTELKHLVGEGQIVSLRGRFRADELRDLIANDARVRIASLEDGRALLNVGAAREVAAEVLARVLSRGLGVDDVSIQEPSLQGVFLKLTGRELRD